MSSSKLIVVLGATGTQGGSVVRTFLDDPMWRVRGITRNVSGEAAKGLTAKGVETIQASLDDPDSLISAFRGASAIFSATDFWNAFMDPANQSKLQPGQSMGEWTYNYELQQGKNVFDAAAKTEGLERLVFSSLADVSKWSKGKYNHVYHFDSKAHAAEYGKRTYPDLWAKTSIIQVGWYLNNWLIQPSMMPQQDENGAFNFVVGVPGDLKLPLVATEEDTGPMVKALVNRSPGKNLIAYKEWMTVDEFVDTWSKVLNMPAKRTTVSMAEVAPEVVRRELAENFAFWEEFGYEGRDDPSLIHPRDLEDCPALGTVEDWIKRQDWSAVLQA